MCGALVWQRALTLIAAPSSSTPTLSRFSLLVSGRLPVAIRTTSQ